jgi:hypothetical protein
MMKGTELKGSLEWRKIFKWYYDYNNKMEMKNQANIKSASSKKKKSLKAKKRVLNSKEKNCSEVNV